MEVEEILEKIKAEIKELRDTYSNAGSVQIAFGLSRALDAIDENLNEIKGE